MKGFRSVHNAQLSKMPKGKDRTGFMSRCKEKGIYMLLREAVGRTPAEKRGDAEKIFVEGGESKEDRFTLLGNSSKNDDYRDPLDRHYGRSANAGDPKKRASED